MHNLRSTKESSDKKIGTNKMWYEKIAWGGHCEWFGKKLCFRACKSDRSLNNHSVSDA